MTPTRIILGLCAMPALLMAFAMHSAPPPAPPQPPPVVIDTAPRVIQMTKTDRDTLKFEDRIASVPPIVSIHVPAGTTVLNQYGILKGNTMKEAEPKHAVRHQHHASSESDVCTRHGMHKVVTHGGKSWRCK